MKKWRRGKGTRLTASLRRSAFSWPGKRRQQVMPGGGWGGGAGGRGWVEVQAAGDAWGSGREGRGGARARGADAQPGAPRRACPPTYPSTHSPNHPPTHTLHQPTHPPTRHDSRDEVVEVAKGGGGELEGAEADVIQRLVVQDHALIGVLHQLVHRESGVVGLHHSVRHLQGGCPGGGVGARAGCKVQASAWRAAQGASERGPPPANRYPPWGRGRQRRWPSCGRGTPRGSC